MLGALLAGLAIALPTALMWALLAAVCLERIEPVQSKPTSKRTEG